MKDPELEQFGKHLKLLRKRFNISQEQFALESGLARSYVSDVERGMRNPTLKKILLIQRTLGVDMEDLFSWLDQDDVG